MNLSWSFDSVDTSLVTIDIGGDFHKDSKSHHAIDKNTDANETDTTSTTDTASTDTIAVPLPPSSSIQCCHVSQCYHMSQSTEIQSRYPTLFGVPNEYRIVRFRFGVYNAQQPGKEEKHEVILRWNVGTGERSISYDRTILHTMTLRGFRVCDQTVLTPRFSLRVLSCTEAPLGASEDFRTSELLVNGVSCYDLPTMGRHGILVQRRSRPAVDHQQEGRKSFKTIGEILCPEAMNMSRNESRQRYWLHGIE